MKQKSIFKQLLIPMIAIVTALAVVLTVVIVVIVSKSYEKEIYKKSEDKSMLVAGEISAFMDGAFSMTEEMSKNPSILTMDTNIQTPILKNCVERNKYLELLYIQDTTGMQTGRSSGALADRSTRWWFTQTMNDKKSFISKSYYSVNTGMPCASIFFPMYASNDICGVFAVDIKLDYLQSIIEQFSDTDNGEYSFIIDGEGVVVAHPDSKQIEELYNYAALTKTVSRKDSNGNILKDENGNILTEEQSIDLSSSYQQVIQKVMAGESGSTKLSNSGESFYVSYASIALKGDSDSWSVITVHKVSNAMSMVTRIIIISIILAVIALVIAAITIAKIAKKLTSPILSLTGLVTAVAEGDFSQRANESSNNELGTLAKGFNIMSDKISATLNDMNLFSSEVVQSSERLIEIESKTDTVNEALKNIKSGTESQAIEVNEVVVKASNLEDKFSMLKKQSQDLLENVEKTIESEQAGSKCVEELQKQNTFTTEMITESYNKIVSLEEQSQKISGIVGTINEISSQTSLLALNASIEAARAGEQGRGFAVVAESIGKLAQDSGTATASIESIINDLCLDIESTVRNVETINNVILSQSDAVIKVQNTFEAFKVLAERTESALEGIEALVNEMNDISQMIVLSVEKICKISENTDGLADEVKRELEEQLEAIQHVSKKVNDLSRVTNV